MTALRQGESIGWGEGTHAIRVAGEHAVCDPRGVLYLPDHEALVVSDLHLEKGAAFARRGMFLPPHDTAETLARLAAVVLHYDPKVVVSLGDSFHDRFGASHMPEAFRDMLCGIIGSREWFWIAGNHDREAPERLPGTPCAELRLGQLAFRHLPGVGPVSGEVAGHLHPCAKIVARGRPMRLRCFASDGERLVMPAFGAYAGSLNVLDRAYTNLFRWEGFTAFLMGNARIFPAPRAALVGG